MLLDTFGARVRYLRRLWGLRQGDFYQVGGPSRSTLSRIESGNEGPGDVSEATLQGLSLLLKCTRQWLETGSGKVWQDGVIPPPATPDEFQLQVDSEDGHSHEVTPKPEPEQGKFTSEGTMDWKILEKAVDIVLTRYHETGGAFQDWNINFAEAYRLVYLYLRRQQDAFDPKHESAVSILLTVAGE